MVLTSLSLQNFRSYKKHVHMFTPGTTLILGANATGKTNVLEAVMLLATGKSFRAGKESEMIRWGAQLSVVGGQTTDGEEDTTLEIFITSGVIDGQKAPNKKCLVNGVSRRLVDFIGNVRAVLFWPEDMELVTDSPSRRRKYLDTVLIQIDREYRRSLLSYERGIRQRNKLLGLMNEGKASRSQLLFWDQLLIRAGALITNKRSSYIAFVNSTTLSGHSFRIEYDKSVISEARLLQYQQEEVAAKSTLVGPHRDDFTLLAHEHGNGQEQGLRHLGKYGSRGEQRLAVLWLKLAELSFIEKETGGRPVLLLDDIFSELDEGHRALVGEVIGKQQTIITSADSESVPAEVFKGAAVIRL